MRNCALAVCCLFKFSQRSLKQDLQVSFDVAPCFGPERLHAAINAPEPWTMCNRLGYTRQIVPNITRMAYVGC